MRSCRVWLAVLPFLLVPAGCDLEEVLADSAPFREDFSYSYPLKAGGYLALENFNGPVEILSWEKDEVRITGQKYARTESELRELKVEVSAGDDAVRIRTIRPAGRRGGTGARFFLRVPRQVELERITSSNGPIRVEDTRGASRLETSNGAITLRRIQGRLEARTSNASISGDQLQSEALLRTSNGSIRLDQFEGSLQAITSNAGINVRFVKPAARRPLKLETSNGSIELTMDAFEENEIRATTSNASITLRLPATLKARLSAATSNGAVSSDFQLLTRSAGKSYLEGDIGGGGALIQLSSSNGSIRLLRQ